jgi:Cof subfamily protein (haloacid dehalogenase superfamily)
MGYKLIALDIDGTIRSADYPISDRTRETLDKVMEAGAVVTLATGRMFRSAVRSTSGLDLKSPIASFQGAHIADPATGEVLWHMPLTPSMTREALDALEPWGLEVMAYYNHEVYVGQSTERIESYGARNEVGVHVVDDLKSLADKMLTRLVVVGNEDEIQRLEAEMKAHFDTRLHITRSLPHFCEILHPDGGKHKALEWMCNHLGIRQEETIAFGNGYNDVHMLGWAGLGVAIGGAVPEVLAVADSVTPPIEQDGVAIMLESLLDQGLIG